MKRPATKGNYLTRLPHYEIRKYYQSTSKALAKASQNLTVLNMQVEPVRWPHVTARKVINNAVEEAVSEALLQDAQRAIDRGFQGSISRYCS